MRSNRVRRIASRTGWGLFALALIGCTETLRVGDRNGASQGGSGGQTEEPDASAHDGGHSGGGPKNRCEYRERLSFQRGQAMLLVLLQRSTSMLSPFDGETRLGAAHRALLAATVGVHAAIGLVDFPAINTDCGARLLVPPVDLAREGTLQRAFRCDLPFQYNRCFETSDMVPTAEALDEVERFFRSFIDGSIERRVLLITDGDPTCDRESNDPCARAIAKTSALMALHHAKTQLIGIGGAAERTTCLGQIALAGGTATPDGVGFPVAHNFSELQSTVKRQIEELDEKTCTLKVNAGFTDPATLDVTIQGRSVRYDPTGRVGWNVENDGLLRFVGEDCRHLRDARTQDVSVYRCCSAEDACSR
ncbi:MAG: vWA domain-containing protein [Deltaproteobacteria bacterium]|nr:vWA domain-containing protein [Deltaproteobacteria bacterium]